MPPLHDRLTLTREINRSGIATVWEGYDTSLDRKVLVKAIHPQYARDPELRTRFEREARAIARISHPNVVQIFDLEIDEDKLRLILEFVEGQTLSRLMKDRGKFPPQIAISIACSILEGLKAAHADGIIHRDLKPDNILISKKGETKITDFGLATLKDQPTVTMEGAVLGTPTYMSPEQALGTALSENTDLFTAGLILFEMLTGKRVIEGDSMREAFSNVVNYQPPDLSLHADCIPAFVIPLLGSLLAREPGNRLKSAAETYKALSKTTPVGVLPITKVEDYLTGSYVEEAVVFPPPESVILPVQEEKPREPEEAADEEAPEEQRAQHAGKHGNLHNWMPWLAGAFIVLSGFIIWYLLPPQKSSEPQTAPIDTTQVTDTLSLPETSVVAVPPESTRTDSEVVSIPDSKPQPRDTVKKPPVERKPEESPIEVFPGALGFLRVQCKPWARVYIADSLWGTTPLSGPLELTSGIHSIVLMNDEINQPISRLITILPDTTILLDIDLYDYVAKIRAVSVRPWADVYVDGTKEMRTPSNRVIFKPLGKHTITLEHPEFRPYTEEVLFEQGDPIYEIRVDLAQM
ncbi:serine/threonine protein kinase [bacterium]|nr:MAG: serine/threonine protein kinase [bacterium]